MNEKSPLKNVMKNVIQKSYNQFNARRIKMPIKFSGNVDSVWDNTKDGGKPSYAIYVMKDGKKLTCYTYQNVLVYSKGDPIAVESEGLMTSKAGKSYYKNCTITSNAGGSSESEPVNDTQKQTILNTRWKENYRATMSNLIASTIKANKEIDYTQLDRYTRDILKAEPEEFNDQF